MSTEARKPGEHEDADDDLGLDESMSSMRAMFREMRDEEPSDKGMAALLAAAREKADEMKPKRSWFAVLLDQLRRPPVLALATVVVLVGGAVVISGRDDMKAETDPVSSSSRSDSLAEKEPSPGAVTARGGEAPAAESAAAVAPADRAPSEPASREPAEAAPVTQPSRPTAKQGRVRGPRVEEAKPTDGFAFEATESAEPAPQTRPAPKKDEAKAPMAIASDDGDAQPSGGAVATETTAPQLDQKSVSRKPLPSIEGEDRAVKDASIAQLVKQCEAAAAKNDCAAVRTIAARIAKQDPQTYKSRVLKSASIARCLEPPPPMEAAPVSE